MVLKSVAGKDVSQWDFEDLMDLLNDQGQEDMRHLGDQTWPKRLTSFRASNSFEML